VIPTRLAFKVQRDCGLGQISETLIRTSQNRRRKTLQRIGFYGGLTHRRTPSPAFLFPYQQCQRARPKQHFRAAEPENRRDNQIAAPGQGGRCLSRPNLEVNHVFQGFCSASWPALFSGEIIAGA
jgi:hypothetical protein